MAAEEPKDDVARLVELLDEAVLLLEEYDEAHWATWLSTSRREILDHDAHGLLRLQGAYGGMGSFTDLWITEINGHPVRPADESRVNERLSTLRSQIWRLTVDLQHDVDLPGGRAEG